jgi:hypothetical protein
MGVMSIPVAAIDGLSAVLGPHRPPSDSFLAHAHAFDPEATSPANWPTEMANTRTGSLEPSIRLVHLLSAAQAFGTRLTSTSACCLLKYRSTFPRTRRRRVRPSSVPAEMKIAARCGLTAAAADEPGGAGGGSTRATVTPGSLAGRLITATTAEKKPGG